MGGTGAPQAHGPRGPSGSEDRQGLLRIRRAREKEGLTPLAQGSESGRDRPELIRTDTAKATIWAAIAGISQIVAVNLAPGFFPNWYFLLIALGYGLLLPVLAVLHVRHAAVRQSGAVLATSAGTAAIAIGVAASGNLDLVVAAVLVRGIWWWTIGKMWAETGVVPRWLGYPTLMLGLLAILSAVASAPLSLEPSILWTAERLILGTWTLALGYALWRTR